MQMPLTLHLSKCWCWKIDLGFSFLGHIVSSCIHMYNNQISYNNDIEFFYLSNLLPLDWLGFWYSPLPPRFPGLPPRPPLEEESSSTSEVVSPPASTTTYGWMCCKCTFQWCLCSVEYVFMIDEWRLHLINGKCRHVCVLFTSHNKISILGGRLLRIFSTTIRSSMASPRDFSWFIKPTTLV